MRARRAPSGVVLVGLFLSGAVVLVGNVEAQAARIAFMSDRAGNNEIYVMDADGGNLRNVTRHASYDGEPSWSADGEKLAFTSHRGGDGVYIMDALGDPPRRLAEMLVDHQPPSWSPDGHQIAFGTSGRERGDLRHGYA